MSHIFAVEIRRETVHEVAEIVLRSAEKVGFKCPEIEALDTFQVGATMFLRFSVATPAEKLVDAVHAAGRCVVGLTADGFVARLKSRTGKVSSTTMFMIPRQQVKYRGPGAPHWERQFLRT